MLFESPLDFDGIDVNEGMLLNSGLESGDAGSGVLVADEAARERTPSCFWSITIPTDVSPLCSGMNHAQPDSSMHHKIIKCCHIQVSKWH